MKIGPAIATRRSVASYHELASDTKATESQAGNKFIGRRSASGIRLEAGLRQRIPVDRYISETPRSPLTCKITGAPPSRIYAFYLRSTDVGTRHKSWPNRYRELVEKLDVLFESAATSPLYIRELAERLAVSIRTLHSAVAT
jgi:hypothetical protein